MNNLKEYILEKLHLNKDIKMSSNNISKDDIVRFMVIFSVNGKDNYEFYTKYEHAIDEAKEKYFLDGYCLTHEQYDDIINDVMYKPGNQVEKYADWALRVFNYAKENNVVRLFDYEKLK